MSGLGFKHNLQILRPMSGVTLTIKVEKRGKVSIKYFYFVFFKIFLYLKTLGLMKIVYGCKVKNWIYNKSAW